MTICIKDICKQITNELGIIPTKQPIEFYGNKKLRGILNPKNERPEFICIGARPGIGKTALALDIAIDAAREGKRVLIIQPELSPRSIAMLMIKKLSVADNDKAGAAIAHLQELKISIICGETTADIEDCFKSDCSYDLVIVDYIQLIRPDVAYDSRQSKELEVANGLLRISQQYGAQMIVFTQLRRSACVRRYPIISDIHYSGQLAHNSDVIMFITRSDQYGSDADNSRAKIIISKNPFGECGVINVTFDEKTSRFTN